jgi:hypothetical protein
MSAYRGVVDLIRRLFMLQTGHARGAYVATSSVFGVDTGSPPSINLKTANACPCRRHAGGHARPNAPTTSRGDDSISSMPDNAAATVVTDSSFPPPRSRRKACQVDCRSPIGAMLGSRWLFILATPEQIVRVSGPATTFLTGLEAVRHVAGIDALRPWPTVESRLAERPLERQLQSSL